jgi:hypothetical protein
MAEKNRKPGMGQVHIQQLTEMEVQSAVRQKQVYPFFTVLPVSAEFSTRIFPAIVFT